MWKIYGENLKLKNVSQMDEQHTRFHSKTIIFGLCFLKM